MSKENDVTTLQEYVISGIVITFFGLLYWYLSGSFGEADEQKLSVESSSKGYTMTSLGSADANKLSLQNNTKPLSSDSTIAPPKDNAVVAEKAEVSQKAEQAVEVAAKPDEETPKEDLNIDEMKVQIAEGEQKISEIEQQLAVVIPEVQPEDMLEDKPVANEESPKLEETATPVEESPKLEETAAPVEEPKEEEASIKDEEPKKEAADEEQEIGSDLVYRLPSGQKIEIPAKGFENKFKEAIVKGDRNTPIIFDRVYFETGSKELSKESDYQISSTAALLNTYKDINIVIRGHSDNRGSSAKNAQLSLFRSGSMKKALVKLGINPKRIHIEGLGDLEPVASNKTQRGRRKNRRIDLIIK